MKSNSTDLITARIRKLKRGGVFTPKDFIDLASHETVRKVLSRLTERGMIRRLMRGVYDRPASSKVLDGPTPPDPHAIAHAIARAHGWTIVPSGAIALNILGLSTQVPAQWHYFSDGPTKRYRWDGGVLFLQHRTNKEVTGLSPKTALVVHALKALGKSNVDSAVIDHLRKALSKRDRLRALKEARYVTSWIYEIIKQLVAKEV
jgi:predicted transcriptional regulator of viral defense system